jgi:hypothetical protein
MMEERRGRKMEEERCGVGKNVNCRLNTLLSLYFFCTFAEI